MIQRQQPKPLYLNNVAAEKEDGEVLRLPVARCELNPIELAWASVKGYVARHNKMYNLKEVERLTPEGIKHTTTEMWVKFCMHAMKVECNACNDEDLDEDDRKLLDRALQQGTDDPPSTSGTIHTEVCTNPRQQLTHLFQSMDENFLQSILPLQ